MTNTTGVEDPIIEVPQRELWMGGAIRLNDTLKQIQDRMYNSDKPQGLVQAFPGDLDADIQCWINAASVRLLGATTPETAVPRKTAPGWHPEDRQALGFQRANSSQFQLRYRAEMLDGRWKLLVNDYELYEVNGLYFWLGTNVADEVIQTPAIARR